MFRAASTFTSALLFCLAATVSLNGQAVPPTIPKSDTSKEALFYERMDNLVRFENDGSGLREATAVIHIQSQAGVEALGQLIFGYSSANETLTIDYVRVRKPDGQVIETATATAQDFAPEILRQAPMYSDYRQRHVSVAGLRPGDVLEYHTVTHVTPLAPGEFWCEQDFSKQVAVQEEQLQIDIPKSRDIKLKSKPNHPYEMHEAGDRRTYTWTIKDFVPDRKHERDNNDDLDESELQPDVQLSTFTDWQQVAHWYAKLQGERVTVDDKVRKQAADLTRGATTPTEKARRLYNYVALNIRYVSLSFGVGRLQPHAASEVLQNGYGDCKDKHTLLQALLQAEGIQSYPVMINSYRKLDPDVPSPAQFDHVITAARVGGKDSELTWLDATAEVAPYGLIMYQLRNKQAVIASNDANAGLHRTPSGSPVKNVMTMKLDGKFSETGTLDSTIDMTAQGDSDIPVRMAFRRVPQAQWEQVLEYLSAAWGLPGDVSEIHVDSLEDTSKPFHLNYHLQRDNFFNVPSSGNSFQILPVFARRSITRKKKSSEPLDVGPAEESSYRAHLQFPANFTIHVPEDVRMTRDFGDYSLTYVLSGKVLEAERHFVLKVNELPAARRPDYESFRTVISSPVEQGLWCSATPASSAALASANTGGTPEQMQKSARAAFERNDFTTAADLLKKVVEQDAQRKDAWDDLGLAYSDLNQHDDAIRAFQKQIEVDPEHPRAHGDLAAELQAQGKLDDAVAAYRSQIETTPSDQSAHKNLGLLLAQMQRDQDARTELETADSIPPGDPQVKMALAQVYARTGDKTKSEALMKSVIGVNASAGDDIYSAALRDDVDPNQTMHDARQTLDGIGDQFDSGEYNRLSPSVFSAMNLVALAWARVGWASFLQGDTLGAMQFLNSSWMLSQSGTAGNRLARVLEKEGQHDKARHMFALAAAAGGADVEASRQQVAKLSSNPEAAAREISNAGAELLLMRTVKLPGAAPASGSARFALVFDSSNKPERAEYLDGDASLRASGDKLREKDFPVKFPDASSVKIVRKATLTCGGSGCSIVFLPLKSLSAASASTASK